MCEIDHMKTIFTALETDEHFALRNEKSYGNSQ